MSIGVDSPERIAGVRVRGAARVVAAALTVAGMLVGSAVAVWAAPIEVVDEPVTMVQLSADEQALYSVNFGGAPEFVALDPQTGAVLNSLPLPAGFGWQPSFALSPDGAFAYVIGQSSPVSTLLKIDLTTFTVTPVEAPLPGGGGAFDIAISADGSRVYVGKSIIQNVTVIDTATMGVVTTVPVPELRVSSFGIRMSPSGDRLYLPVGTGNDQIGVFDTATNTVATTWSPGVETFPMTVAPTGELYVFDTNGSSMSVLSPVDGSVLRTVPLFPGEPATFWTDAEFSPDYSRIYLIVASTNEIRSIDAATGAALGTILLTGTPAWGMDPSSDGRTAYTGVQAGPSRALNIARAPVADTTGIPATATVGIAYAGVIGAGPGTDVNTFQVVSGALPDGLTLDTATGQITGTPTVPGVFTSTIRVQNALDFSDATITITVTSTAPVIANLNPDTGPTTGGTVVTITGDNLQGATSVTVDGIDVPFTDNGDGTLTLTTPPHTAGTVDVTVTTPSGTTPPVNYTYIAPTPTPPAGTPPAPGTPPAAGALPATGGSWAPLALITPIALILLGAVVTISRRSWRRSTLR